MLLSTETFAVRERVGDERAIEMIAAAGFDAIDYSFYWTRPGEDMLAGSGYREYAHSLKALADKNNIVFNQAHAPFVYTYSDTREGERFARLVRSIEFAAILGAENIVVHSIDCPKDADFSEYNYRFYKELEPYCAEYGIRIAVENLFTYDGRRRCFCSKMGSARELNSFVQRLDSEHFSTCLDIGHSSLTGTDPDEFIRALDKNYFRSVHVQDNDYLDDRHVPPYMGGLDWNKIAKAFAESGYDGDITLEVFNFLKKYEEGLLPAALKFAEQTGRYLIKKINEYK